MESDDVAQMAPESSQMEDMVDTQTQSLGAEEPSAGGGGGAGLGSSLYGENKGSIPKTGELGSSAIKEYLEFEPLKISLYELIMRQLMDDGLVEVAQLLHIKTKTCIPIHLGKNSLYNLYKTVTYLPMDLRPGNHETSENSDLLELKSTNYVKRIESLLPHLENLTNQWVPIKPRSRYLYYYKKRGNYINSIMKSGNIISPKNIKSTESESIQASGRKGQDGVQDSVMRDDGIQDQTRSVHEFYMLENVSKIKLEDSWSSVPGVSVSFRGSSVLSNHRPYCRALAVNPNGGYIATGGADGIVKILPAPSLGVNGAFHSSIFGIGNSSSLSSQQKTFTESKGIITSLEYRIRRDVLISGDTDSSIIIYDVKGISGGTSGDPDEGLQGISGIMGGSLSRASKKPIQVIRESSPITCIQMHPLDDHFFVGTQDPVLRLYDINTNDSFTSTHPSHQHSSGVRDIRVSQDGAIACTCSDDGTIKFWDSVNLSCINTIYGAHGGLPVHSLSFSLSQRYLLSSGGDGVARLWDLRMGKELVRYSSGLRSSSHSKVSLLVDERYAILSAVDAAGASYSRISGGSSGSGSLGETLSGQEARLDPLASSPGVGSGSSRAGILGLGAGARLNYAVLDHQMMQNPLGDLLIFSTLSGSLVGKVEGIHDAPVMNFELLYNSNSGLGNGVGGGIQSSSHCSRLPSLISDCSLVTVSDDGKCRILDLNYSGTV
ncbi:WD repeat protein [Cryptosporidium canis]|uniref:Cleavage stimulation factor 50 kDa subunit n=1 Tax=Cryptosporidium canis TaxID=195482 RepID=A0ABQ8P961_9CRYT|nr:WD repeat protein [Cryptosporidium canis]